MDRTGSSGFGGAEGSELMQQSIIGNYGYVRRTYGSGNPFRVPDGLESGTDFMQFDERGTDEQRIASLRAQISAATNNGPGSNIIPEAAAIPTFQNRCPRGHDLRADVYSDSSSTQLQPQCSGCGSEIASAGFIWRCRESCDFKLCDNCRFGR